MLKHPAIHIRDVFQKLPSVPVLLISALISALAITPSFADDTEVFFGQNDGAFEVNPNILFVLDVSGSMTGLDGVGVTRLDRMKSAMRTLLDESSGYNVGVMTFQGAAGGGAIRYPVGDLDAVSISVCEEGVCPDQNITVKPIDDSDDAYQNTETLEVTINDDHLIFGSVPVNADGTPATDVETSTTEAGVNGVILTRTRTTHSSVTEVADISTGVLSWKYNEVTDKWFHENVNSRDTWSGYRIPRVPVQPGAKIVSAYLEFDTTGLENQSGEVSARIIAEKNANPTLLPENGSGRLSLISRAQQGSRTNAIVSWDTIPGTEDNLSAQPGKLRSPDISTIVQELVNDPSWQRLNPINFIITPKDDYDYDPGNGAPPNIREVNSHGSDTKPRLVVTYESRGTEIATVESTNSNHVDEFHSENFSSELHQDLTNTTSTLFHAGPGFEPRRLALRFPDIDIPQDSFISTATLKLRTKPQLKTGDENDVPTNPIAINISAELSADPESDTTTPLKLRDLSPDFVSWTGIPEDDDVEITSPNIASVISDIVALENWTEGNTLSLVLSAPGDYIDLPSNVREIFTSQSAFQPVLEISWEREIEDVQNDLTRYTSAVRFRNVHVPPNAEIKGARLVMHASEISSGTENVFISGEKIANSDSFSSENNDIGARQKTTSRVTWPMQPWTTGGDPYTSVEVSDIVEEITSQQDWCGGNPLTLFLDGETIGTDRRVAQSIEQNSLAHAVSLEIEYEPANGLTGSYCSNTTQIVAIDNTLGNATENITTNTVDTLNAHLSTDNQAIGLRFDGVDLPTDAVITTAAINVVAAADLDQPFNATISVENDPDPELYLPWKSSAKVLSRTYGSSINWKNNGSITTGDSLYSSDVSSLVTEAISQNDWAPGNAVAFKITTSSGLLDIVSSKGDESLAAQLILYYQTEREDTRTQNRLNIQRTVDDTVAKGNTPTVEAMFEAANYFRGGNVDYGTFRGTNSAQRRYFRVSHPDSYTGGSVSRDDRCMDNDLNNVLCQGERILTAGSQPVYTSPIESECQTNHIVLLSDGNATSNNAVSRIESLIGSKCASTPDNKDDQCGNELAAWLANADHSPSLAGDQTITTHTIPFNLQNTEKGLRTRASLENMAKAGGGFFEPAESAAELLQAFKRIFNNVSNANASFVAPAASVSQFNRLRNSTDVFYGMFKPSGSARWPGNLKKYRVGLDSENNFDLQDANGNSALDESTGGFYANAKSFWSTVPDGDQVEEGGASEQVGLANNSYLDRKVYTYTGTSRDLLHASNKFSSDNNQIDVASFFLPPTVASDNDQVTDLIDWSVGRDVLDEDQDNDINEVRPHIGDPMHSTPLVAGYSDGESVIYMSTNEGFLHAIDADDGSEHFAFVPEELFRNLYRLFRNEPTQNRVYGLDGGKTLWHEDIDDDGLIDTNETAILYIGMRRGGDSYFALDISDYKKPKYLWSIKGGAITADDNPGTADGDYQALGSTWSLPVKTQIVDGTDTKDVIIFGGGYDPNQDPSDDGMILPGDSTGSLQSRTTDSIGTAIFIADAETGELIWQTTVTDPRFSDMNYSIPSQVRTIDINFDGVVDQLYVGDMGGQVWRMDFNNDPNINDSLNNRITAGTIAELAGDTPESNRRFYYPPDISVITVEGEQAFSIAIGSGWRAHPLDDVVEDRLYSLRSRHVFGPPIDSFGQLSYDTVTENSSGMIDVTNNLDAEVDADARGWYLRLDTNGEKIVSSSLTFNGQLAVTTYSPSVSTVSSCAASLGTGFVYALDVTNGSPILNLDGKGSENDLTTDDRKDVLQNPGIPPEVSILFPDLDSNPDDPTDAEPLFQVGKEIIEELDGGEPRRTTFWQEVTEGHDE